MKRLLILMVLVGMAGGVSATELRFTDIFSECTPEMGYMECSSRFFVPNIHLTAGKILIGDAILGILELTRIWFTDMWDLFWSMRPFSPSWWLNESIPTFKGMLELIFLGFPIMLRDYGIGIVSAVFVFIIILALEFIKDYLIVSIAWLCLTRALDIDSKLFSLDRAFIVGGLMVVGSVVLLTLDWGNAIMEVIG